MTVLLPSRWKVILASKGWTSNSFWVPRADIQRGMDNTTGLWEMKRSPLVIKVGEFPDKNDWVRICNSGCSLLNIYYMPRTSHKLFLILLRSWLFPLTHYVFHQSVGKVGGDNPFCIEKMNRIFVSCSRIRQALLSPVFSWPTKLILFCDDF